MDKKTIIAWIIFVLVVAAGVWYYMNMKPVEQTAEVPQAPVKETLTDADLVGVWARDDGKAYTTREFRADGTIEDRFDGDRDGMIDNSVTGTWKIMSASDLATVTLPFMDASGTVVRVEFPEEAFYMMVNELEEGVSLSFIYYGQDGAYRYERI